MAKSVAYETLKSVSRGSASNALTLSPSHTIREINKFTPQGWQLDAWSSMKPVLLMSGAAGSGKSRLAHEKLHALLMRYPESSGLLLRKTRSSLTNSSIVMMNNMIIGSDNRVSYRVSKNRWEYDNGSILIYSGMSSEEDSEKIRSAGLKGGIDFALLEEATQFNLKDYQEIRSRMRGDAGPFRQVMLCTNPDGPAHWIYTDLIMPYNNGQNLDLVDYYSPKPEDNPYLPDDYIETLKGLKGIEYERFYLGNWTQATGVVFPEFYDDYDMVAEPMGNVTDEADYIPGGGDVFWAIDDGVTGSLDSNGYYGKSSHPRAILWIQVRHDGSICVFNETQRVRMSPAHGISEAEFISGDSGYPQPKSVVADKAAATLRLELDNSGYFSIFNAVPFSESIKLMRTWLHDPESQTRKILVHPRCIHLRHEFRNYGYHRNGSSIVKAYDHSLDALRYFLWEHVVSEPTIVDIIDFGSGSDKVVTHESITSVSSTPGLDIATF
jgi:hypothetical protein